MVWREGKGAYPSQWTGPMKVVVDENAQTVWTTMASKLHRAAPEYVRPVSAMEAKQTVIFPHESSVSIIAQQIPHNQQSISRVDTQPDVSLPPPPNPSAHNPDTTNNPHNPNSNHPNNPEDD